MYDVVNSDEGHALFYCSEWIGMAESNDVLSKGRLCQPP